MSEPQLHIVNEGEGYPVIFQHGLGGDRLQVADNFPAMASVRRITVECRGHGLSTAGSARPFSIQMFADDIIREADRLGYGRFVVGGISMGAAIALNIAVRYPSRVRGLILARPAWVSAAAPGNMRPFAEVAQLLKSLPPEAARDAFAASPLGQTIARDAPDNYASLTGFFARPDAALTADLLGDIAADGPRVSRAQISAITCPTLCIGHGVDYVHPLGFAVELAGLIPQASMVEIAPKATDKSRHGIEFRAAVQQFLNHLFSNGKITQ